MPAGITLVSIKIFVSESGCCSVSAAVFLHDRYSAKGVC